MNWTGLKTLLYREIKRFLGIPMQTVLPPLISAVLYILVFGRFLGPRIQTIGGISYIDFIVPGLLMMNVTSGAFSNTSSSIYIGRFQNHIQELLVSPLSYFEIVLGYVISGAARGVIVGLGTYLIALFFTSASINHFWAFLYFIIVTSLSFSAIGAIIGLWAKNFDQVNLPVTFILLPLNFLAGTFYSISMIPPALAKLSYFNPIFYMVNGIRASMIGVSDVSMGQAALVIAALTIIFTAWCVYLFKAGYNLRT